MNIEILAPGTFKFQSVDGGNLDAIDSITIANGVTGTVAVFIERDTDDGSPGATNIGSINLTNASGVLGNLAYLNITGSFGTSAVSTVNAVTGDVIIGDSGSDDLIRSPGASAGGVTGN